MTLEQILFHLICNVFFFFSLVGGKISSLITICFCFLYMSITCGHLVDIIILLYVLMLCGLSILFAIVVWLESIYEYHMRSVLRNTARCRRCVWRLTIRRLLLRTSIAYGASPHTHTHTERSTCVVFRLLRKSTERNRHKKSNNKT